MSTDPTVVLLKNVRLSYPRLFTPRSFGNDPTKPAKYSAGLMISKADGDLVKAVAAAVKAAIAAGVTTKFGGKSPAPSTLSMPYVDGDAKDPETGQFLKENEELRGVVLLSATSKQRPQTLTASKDKAVEEDVWPGEYAHVLVKFAPYLVGANKGVACYLNAVMLTGRGDRIDGRVDAMDAFAGIEESFGSSAANDDPSEYDDLLGVA